MKKELIQDKRLTLTMQRWRSGRTQVFKEKNKDDVRLEHKNKEMYAELIDNQWYWVNGCGSCNGEGRSYKTYIECEVHDVCRSCEVGRKEIKGSVWGYSKGWMCTPCHEAEQLEIRRQAFEKFNEDKLDEHHFLYMDGIKCPHCGSEISNDDMYETQDIECSVCEGEISLEVEHSFTYSTSIKGKRITQ